MVSTMSAVHHPIHSFPLTLKAVSKPWLATVLAVPDSDLLAFTVTAPAVKRGYGSDIGFIHLQWRPGTATRHLPEKLLIKVMPDYPATAEMARQRRTFCREARFYHEFAASTPVRLPKAYAALWDDATGDAVLLLEDCSAMQAFSFFNPPDLAQLEHIVDAAARFHAHWWGRTAALDTSEAVMSPSHPVWRQWAGEMAANWAAWLDSSMAASMSPEWTHLCRKLAATAAARMTEQWPTMNLTLCHMDMHCQNIFFDAATPLDPVVLFDWDGCHLGCGVHDIAYLFGLLPVELRRQVETPLLNRYHVKLLQAGVDDYDHSALIQDYAFGCLFNTFLIPMQLALDLTDEQGLADAQQMVIGLLQMVIDNEAAQLLAAPERG